MLRFIFQRLLQGLLVLFVLLTISFFLISALPGDAFVKEKKMSEEALQEQRARFGLDRPVPLQYAMYLKRLIVNQDLGISPKKNREVSYILKQSFPLP